MPYKNKSQKEKYSKKYYQQSQRRNNPNRSNWAKVRDILSPVDFKKWSQSRRLLLINQKREKIWNFTKTFMISNGCSCGEYNFNKLTFHHNNMADKDMSIRKAAEQSRDKLFKELLKGVVKCKNCHTIIHNGTPEEHTKKLIDKYVESATSKRHRHRNRLLVWYFKQSQKCLNCDLDNPICLLFHHINSDLKKYKIGEMAKRGRGEINKELSKTICLCQNCHEEFHSIHGTKTTKKQLEKYIGKKISPIIVNIKDYFRYLPNI